MSATRTPAAQREAAARLVADTVMYEGYVLFPYRASAAKNRYRWQWGVVVPEAQVEVGASEPDEVVCEVLLQAPDDTRVEVTARFLHLRHRQVIDGDGSPVDQLEIDGQPHVTWDEGHEREVACAATVAQLLAGGVETPFASEASHEVEALGGGAHVERTVHPVAGAVRVSARRLDAQVVALRCTLTNTTPWSRRRAHRDEILRRSLIGAHLLIAVDGGRLGSVIDPQAWAAPFAGEVSSRHLYPVLIGDADAPDDDVVLAAPIILYDHPQIAPESTGPSYDATEVDELLALAVLGMTDREKAEARATDPRAAEIVDRTEALPPAVMQRLHGTIREFGPSRSADPDFLPEPEAGVSDDEVAFFGIGEAPLESATYDGIEVRVGARVRLRPRRRADAHDLFLADRIARVEKLVATVDGDTFAAVTIEDDPAADLDRWYGRFRYFSLDEVELVDGDAPPARRP